MSMSKVLMSTLLTILIVFYIIGDPALAIETRSSATTPHSHRTQWSASVETPHIVVVAEEQNGEQHHCSYDYYTKLYGAKQVFSDLHMPTKHLILGENHLVQLVDLGNYATTLVLDLNHITRIEHYEFSTYSDVRVYDAANQSVSMSVSTDDAVQIMELLKEVA